MNITLLDLFATMAKRSFCLLLPIFLLVCDFLLPAVVAQSGIAQATATLSESRSFLAAASSGELVFFGGGEIATVAGTPSAQIDICNATNGSWTTATLSIPRADLVATSVGNFVMFGGGVNSSYCFINLCLDSPSSVVDIYNVKNNTWATATLSQARAGFAATSVGNLVLFGGGVNGSIICFDSLCFGSTSKVVDIYNVTSDTWATATLSQARYFHAATSVASRYALFAGGWNGTYGSNVVDIFDSLSGIWNTTTLSQPREYLAAASVDNLAFFGGGDDGTQTSNVVDIFNATSQTWSTATLSQNRTGLAATSFGDIVAFGGGTPDNNVTFSAVVDMYNMTSDVWFTANLSQPRAWLAATSSTDKIFFGGGWNSNSGGYVNTVDIFDIQLSPPPPKTLTKTGTTPLSLPAISSTPSNGALIGGLIGGIVGALLVGGGIVLLVILLKKKRKKSTRDRNTEALPTEEQTKTLQTNQQETNESDIKPQTKITSSQYIAITKSTAQLQTSQVTQSVELSARHHIPF
jgi:hypothetical protein